LIYWGLLVWDVILIWFLLIDTKAFNYLIYTILTVVVTFLLKEWLLRVINKTDIILRQRYQNVSMVFRFMVFNATYNNISVISWWSVLLVEETTDLSQVTDKLYHTNVSMEIQWSWNFTNTYFGYWHLIFVPNVMEVDGKYP